MGKKPLELEIDADLDDVVEGEEVYETDETIKVDEEESPEDRAEREALEAEMEKKFSEKKIEGEFSGEEDDGKFSDEVVEGGDLSAKIQLLRRRTQRRVGRGGRKSISIVRLRAGMRKKSLFALADLEKDLEFAGINRPRERADCVNGQRPCLWVGCRYHLYLDVNSGTGSLKYNFPNLEVGELPVSCALDVADAGETSTEDVAVLLNVCRGTVCNILGFAVDKIVDSLPVKELKRL